MISGGQKNLRPLHELSSEPAIRSNNTGQWTPYFDCCHLTITWIFLHTLDSYNPGQTSLGQWSSIRNFLSFLDVLIKQCNLLKITFSSPSSPIISVGMNQDKNLAWRLKMLNDWYVMQLLQEYLMTWYHWNVKVPMKPVLPSHHPMQSWKLRTIMLFVGWGEGFGMYDYKESPTNASVT